MSKEEKLRKLVEFALESSPETLSLVNISKDDIIDSYLLYNLDVTAYSNEVYDSLGVRVSMYLQSLLPETWHQQRQDIVLDMLEKIKPKSIVDLGFGVPEKYVKDYVLKKNAKLTLVDFYESAFGFAKEILNVWDDKWKEKISFKNLDMNSHKYVGDFDCYLFLDSIEHVNNPSKYLKKTVKKSLPGSKYILSLPIGPKIPSHTVEWRTEEEAIEWLEGCGLLIDRKEKVYPNPKVDLFATEIDGVYNLVISCSKKYDITNLPLLDKVKSLYSGESLENTLLLVCHHVLKSNLILLDYLIKLGIKPRNTFLIGKSYSTCKNTLENYKRLKINVSDKSLEFDSHKSFDEQFSMHIKGFLKEIACSGYDRILILDDGGELLVQSNEIFKDDKRVVGVEQTSSGYNKLRKLKLNFPVINVATSKAKLVYETPFIIESISKEIHKRLRQMDREIRNVLIIGNGPIGKELAKDFNKKFEVSVYDRLKDRSEISDGSFFNLLSKSDLVIGCSGAVSLPESFHPLLKENVILVSTSSSDREFESHKIRMKHTKTTNTHKDFHGENIVLLNGGFPINFDGHKLSIPLEDIQLTEALMFAGAIQAIRGLGEGIVDLDLGVQDFIIREFESLSL